MKRWAAKCRANRPDSNLKPDGVADGIAHASAVNRVLQHNRPGADNDWSTAEYVCSVLP